MTDFLKEIEKAETRANDIVRQAKADADLIVKQAEADGANIIDDTCAKANVNKKAMIKNAETDANSKCKNREIDLDREIEMMRKSAKNNMDRAVHVILEKVGSI